MTTDNNPTPAAADTTAPDTTGRTPPRRTPSC